MILLAGPTSVGPVFLGVGRCLPPGVVERRFVWQGLALITNPPMWFAAILVFRTKWEDFLVDGL
jgi:hypothetical protein